MITIIMVIITTQSYTEKNSNNNGNNENIDNNDYNCNNNNSRNNDNSDNNNNFNISHDNGKCVLCEGTSVNLPEHPKGIPRKELPQMTICWDSMWFLGLFRASVSCSQSELTLRCFCLEETSMFVLGIATTESGRSLLNLLCCAQSSESSCFRPRCSLGSAVLNDE